MKACDVHLLLYLEKQNELSHAYRMSWFTYKLTVARNSSENLMNKIAARHILSESNLELDKFIGLDDVYLSTDYQA